MQSLLRELGMKIEGPSTLHVDNLSALRVLKNPEHHGCMKHLDLWFYWLQDVVEDGPIKVQFLRTEEMPTDLMTKALVKFYVDLVGLIIRWE